MFISLSLFGGRQNECLFQENRFFQQGTNFYEFDGNMENIRNFARGMSISNQE